MRSALSPPACLPSSPPFPKRSQSLWLAAQETIPRESLKTRLCSESRRAYGELCAAWLWGELSPVGGKGSTRRSVGHGGVGEAFFGGGFVPPQPPLHPSVPFPVSVHGGPGLPCPPPRRCLSLPAPGLF